MCLVEGLTNAQLAERFGVGVATVARWRKDHPEFRDALKVGKDMADARVKKSLYELANGYRFTTKKTARKASKVNGKETIEVTETTTETFIPPHATAAIFWLKNRDPEHFRDNPERGTEDDSAEAIREWMDAAAPDPESVAELMAAMNFGTPE